MGENKEYMTLQEENGTVYIAEKVIAAIAAGAVREVEGISGMVNALSSITDLTGRKSAQKGTDGVKVTMDDAALTLDLYVTVAYGHPLQEVAENAQKAVTAAVSAMTGCTVNAVNIHMGGVTLA